MADTADAVVVGAGVIGASIAYELARGGRRVVVVDKLGAPGQGSTSASSAIVRFNYSTSDGVAMSWEAKHCWERFGSHLGADDRVPVARFHRTGLAMLDVAVAPVDATAALLARVGVPHEVWDADTLTARMPELDAGRYWPPKRLADAAFWADATGRLGALFMPDAGFVDDPQLAAANFADAARRRGAAFRFHEHVTSVRRTSDRVRGVTLTSGDTLDAPVVVNAAGPWSGALNRLAGVEDDFTISVRPMRQEVHHVAAPPAYSTDERLAPVVADLDLGTYFRPALGGALLVGGTEPECDPLQWIGNPDDASPNVTADLFEAQVTRAARRLPALAVPRTPRGVAGVYDVADDWTPIYDRTALDGFYVAIGTSGNQFKNAPLVGRAMATLIDRVEHGHDHDRDPVRHTAEHTGLTINLGTFSRRRPPNAESTGTVLG